MAIAVANYALLMCDVGTNERVSYGGVIDDTIFMKKLLENQLNLPAAESVIPGNPPLAMFLSAIKHLLCGQFF